jgi:hypothetical protein
MSLIIASVALVIALLVGAVIAPKRGRSVPPVTLLPWWEGAAGGQPETIVDFNPSPREPRPAPPMSGEAGAAAEAAAATAAW